MIHLRWQSLALIERIHWLRYTLPPTLVLVVVAYQLGVTQALERNYGHFLHYSMEIAFYSLTGPVVTWLMLVWVERKLKEKEKVEQQLQAAEREKTAVLNEERTRIARDLHDGVAQTLYFLALKTDMLRQQLAHNPAIVAELRQMGQNTRQVIREVRRTIFALNPPDWSEAGFIPALKQFATDFAEQVGWQLSLSIEAGLTITPRLEPIMFRLVQESLNNVAKHAEAAQIWIMMQTSRSGELKLVIRDNGTGFDINKQGTKGLGLKQMSDRVTAVGGTFHIESQLERGTAVTVRLPLVEITK